MTSQLILHQPVRICPDCNQPTYMHERGCPVERRRVGSHYKAGPRRANVRAHDTEGITSMQPERTAHAVDDGIILDVAAQALPAIQGRFDRWAGDRWGAGFCGAVATTLINAFAGTPVQASWYSHDDHAQVQLETDDSLWLLDVPMSLYEDARRDGHYTVYRKRPHRFDAADLQLERVA